MPFFDFVCPECHNIQNELCKYDAIIYCVECNALMSKQVSAPQCIQANFSPRYHPRRK